MSSAMPLRTEHAPVRLGTKGETLLALADRLAGAAILPIALVDLNRFRKDRAIVLLELANVPWIHKALAVRSSAEGEDGLTESKAGRYRSILNVIGLNALETAIDEVVSSYGDEPGRHQVLIQPMLQDAVQSGVLFSMDPNSGAPYCIINFTENGDTQAITSGASAEHRTIILSRGAPEISDPLAQCLAALAQEIESLTGQPALDIEFATDRTGTLYLLQARPLVLKQSGRLAPEEHTQMLAAIADRIRIRTEPHPYLFGQRTVLGVMPDWNPAEIIGTRPRPLALSLYRELVTDAIWAYQRHNYGYRNLRSFPLLCDFFGVPYIDVRVSFNSFLPSDLPDGLAEHLANHYIDALCDKPSLHDKVEFEIIYSCYTLDLPQRLRALSAAGFGDEDIACLEDSLRALTNRIINKENGLWRKDLAKLDTLNTRFETMASRIEDPVAQIYWLLEDCKRYGTLPFAGLARAGFIAVQILRSLVSVGALSEENYQAFLASLNTVSSEMSRDFKGLARAEFLRRYGHLRPGTYDIRSPRYDATPDVYFNWTTAERDSHGAARPAFALTLEQMNIIEKLLIEHRLEHDVVGLFNFLKAGIEGRERAKFIFSRSLSYALERITDLGARYGFDRDSLSYMNIGAIYALNSTCNDPGSMIARSIEEGRQQYARTCALNLPSLITKPSDAWYMETAPAEPNFITQRSVQAPVARTEDAAALTGAIVVIPNADPGYDWLFSHNIGGLITAYGGVNSHMAIRSGELQIPAVIGAGETLFQRWSAARILHMDCANRQVIQVA
jgi:glutamine kinase